MYIHNNNIYFKGSYLCQFLIGNVYLAIMEMKKETFNFI